LDLIAILFRDKNVDSKKNYGYTFNRNIYNGRVRMNFLRKNKMRLIVLYIVLFLFCFVMSVKAAENLNLKEIKSTYNGSIIEVSASKKMNRVLLYKKDKNGVYRLFYKDNTVGESRKQYFISKYRLSSQNVSELKAIAVLEDGSEVTSELRVNRLPERPNPSSSANPSTNPTPSTSNRPSPSITSTPSISDRPSPSITSTPTISDRPSPTVTSTPSTSNRPTATATSSPSTTPTSSPSQAPDVPAQEITISLNKDSITLYSNGKNSEKLKATVKGSNDKISWKSSNTKVAKVDSNGKVTAVSKGTAKITASVGNKSKTCTVTVKELKKVNSTLSTKNCKKVVAVKPKVSDCAIAQSFCVTDKYYVCALIKSGNSKTVIQVYDKNGKLKNTIADNFFHANGMTYNPKNGNIYLTPLQKGKYYTFSGTNIAQIKRISKKAHNFKYSASGVTYDEFKNHFYTTSGKTLRRYDSNMKYKNKFKKYKYTIGQDIGCYNGLILAIDYVRSGNADIYIHRASNGEYLGKYHVSLPGELESVSYDSYKKNFALYFNNGSNNAIYTTTAINLDKYCR